MGVRKIVTAVAAGFAIAATPAMAAQSVSPAASLSLTNSRAVSLSHARVGAKRGGESKIFGLPILLALGLVAAVVTVTVVATSDNSSSN